MGIVNFSADDVLVGEANFIYAPKGTTKPSDSTVEWNDYASWPSGWIHGGYTSEGPNFSYSYEVAEVFAQQSTAAIQRRKTKEVLTMNAGLLQFQASNIALAMGGTVTHTAAGAGQKEVYRVVGGGESQLDEWMAAWESYRIDASGNLQPVRMFFPRVTITQNGDVANARDGAKILTVQVQALLDSTLPVGSQLYDLRDIVGPAT